VPIYPPWSGVNLVVQIVRFVDDHFPGWVASEFVDAEGHLHTFIEKVRIFSVEHMDATTSYPQPGVVRCEILDRSQGPLGQELLHVSTANPDGVESTQGLTDFVVLPSQLSAVHKDSS
jgi:hypothetical protein